MNKIRKILQSALSILMAFVLVFAVGCSSGSGDDGYVITPAPEAPAPTFELSLSQIDCIVGDTDQLSPKSLPNIGDATLTWRSEDSKIVAVDNNGKFEALSEGTTKIIATYGPATATCTIKVSWDSEVPQIVSPANDEGNFAIVVGQEYQFTPTIKYRGNTYNDGDLTVEVSDSAVTALDKATATITGATKGTSIVTISGNWRGREAVRASFNVTVSDDIRLSAIGDGNEIYPTDQVDLYTSAKSFKNLSDQVTTRTFIPRAEVSTDANSAPTVVTMDTNANDFSVTIADNRATFNKSSKKISSVTFGETIATIKFNYDGQTYVKQYFISIDRPVAVFNKEVNFFSSLKGTLRDENSGFAVKTMKEYVYGAKNEVVKTAYIDGDALEVNAETGAILGVTGPSNNVYTVVIRLGTDVEQYDVTTKVYGQYVYEASDLDVFVRTGASPSLNAYVELGRDIDLADYQNAKHFNDVGTSDKSAPNHKWDTNKYLAKGFMGTLDGKGHYLMNYKQTDGHGFFEGLYDATIKNIGFINCRSDASTFLATFTNNLTMENVYIKLTSMAKSTSYWPVGVISRMYSVGGTFKNVYIDIEDTKVSNSMPEGRDRYYWEVYSSVITFPYANKVQPQFENCLVISQAPVSSMGFVSESEGPRIILAENTPESVRVATRQAAWAGQTDAQRNTTITYYKSKYSSNPNLFPSASTFADDQSLYFENYNNNLLDNYGGDVRRAAIVGIVPGIRSYNSLADMKLDDSSRNYIMNFSSDYWTVVDGQLTWGSHPANLKDGDVFLDVGILAGKQVEGMTQNPIKNYKAGQTVQVGALSCFGYIFTGWKNNTTGEELKKVGDKWSFTYSGKATVLVAQWIIDPNVQVGSDGK